MTNDLPGMLDVAQGIAEQKWPHTMDAAVWAAEFKKVFPHPDIDEGMMLGWFANAIMAGYDTAQARAARSSTERSGTPIDPQSESSDPETPGTWEERCAALYQVIGCLASMAGIFPVSDDVSDALDVAAGQGDVDKLLPWPKDTKLFQDLEERCAPRSTSAPITDREPAGYVAVLDAKDAPKGFWYIGAYHGQVAAITALGKQKGSTGKVIPFFFATDAENAKLIHDALSTLGDSGAKTCPRCGLALTADGVCPPCAEHRRYASGGG